MKTNAQYFWSLQGRSGDAIADKSHTQSDDANPVKNSLEELEHQFRSLQALRVQQQH